MKIYAPNKQANGVYASVVFVNGVGETENPRLIEWFKTHGYELEKCEKPHTETIDLCDENTLNLVIESINDQIESNDDQIEPNFDEMTPNELRQWAIENGYGSKIRNLRNKEKLLEILRG